MDPTPVAVLDARPAMKLRRIDILGFKSFRNRTALEIADGVTSVVGPNGCGKSNIVDAIRWSIGSQSAKDLRGRAMEDVIFAGSDSQKPMGLAEVSLVLENDGQDLPAPWREVPEVRITRRLYRTGESEYEVNGQPARLRDIHELFLGTGVGSREAYSIIEQGRIGFIVSARPEERRVIIEEAAGITRYKFQRKTAERRLEKTRENLTRVRDILAEVSRQLGSLERQAKRAAQLRELGARRRVLEITRMLERRERIDASLREQAGGLESLRVASREAINALHIADARLETLRIEYAVQERRVSEATEEFYRVRSRAELLASNVSYQQREIETLSSRVQSIRAELDERQQQQTRVGETLQAEQTRALELNAGSGALEVELQERAALLEDHRARLAAAADESRRVGAELTRLRGVLARATGRLETSDDERQRLQARRDSLQIDIAGLVRELESLTATQTAAQQAVASLSEALQDQQAAFDDAREKEAVLVRELEAHRALVRRLGNEQRGAAATRDGLESTIRSGKGAAEGARRVLEAVEKGEVAAGVRTVASGLRVVDGMDGVVSTLLGPLADALVVDDAASLLLVARWARDKGLAVVLVENASPAVVAVAGVCESLERLPAEVCRRLEQAEIVDDALAQQTRSARIQVDRRRVHRSDSVVDLAGPRTSSAELMFSLRRRLDAAQVEVDRLEQEVGQARATEQRLEANLEEAMRNRAARSEELGRLRDALAERRRALDEATRARLTCERAQTRAADEAGQVDNRIQQLVESVAAVEQEVRVTTDDLKTREAMSDELAARLAAMDEQTHRLTDSMSVARERVGLAQAQRRENERMLERLQLESREVQSRLNSLRTERDTVEARLEETRSNLLADSEGRQQAEEQRQQAEKGLAVLREKFDAVASSMRTVEAEQMERRKLADGAAEVYRRAESGVERTRAELELADQSLLERFEITVFDARREAIAGGMTDAMNHELDDLLEKMEKIGPVNPAAEEEYQEARERHDFMDRQKVDLEAALADLEAAIRKMDKQSRDLFEEMFHAVNERFQVIFPKLFNGGKARLELTDPSNLLETGIDIIVQPPGKRLQSMTLMSGGEKALSAVALIFAIFQLRPTPFCVLDEVDAPLDEANVMRFAEMVAEMSSTSQFIIITHNKRTMEAAHTLYGVTMEEPGISKVVGVKLPSREQGRLGDTL